MFGPFLLHFVPEGSAAGRRNVSPISAKNVLKIWHKISLILGLVPRKVGHKQFHEKSSTKGTSHETKFFHHMTLGSRGPKHLRSEYETLPLTYKRNVSNVCTRVHTKGNPPLRTTSENPSRCALWYVSFFHTFCTRHVMAGSSRTYLLQSADRKRGQRKGATSTNIKNRQKSSRQISTLFDHFRAGQKRQNRQKVAKASFHAFRQLSCSTKFLALFGRVLLQKA